jgi:hypothetical protein
MGWHPFASDEVVVGGRPVPLTDLTLRAALQTRWILHSPSEEKRTPALGNAPPGRGPGMALPTPNTITLSVALLGVLNLAACGGVPEVGHELRAVGRGCPECGPAEVACDVDLVSMWFAVAGEAVDFSAVSSASLLLDDGSSTCSLSLPTLDITVVPDTEGWLTGAELASGCPTTVASAKVVIQGDGDPLEATCLQ